MYKPIFESFVVDEGNREAFDLARKAAAGAIHRLHIVGDAGAGKTHLLYAITGASADSIVRPCAGYVDTVTDSIRFDKLASLRESIRSAPLLLIDDIHELEGKERIQAETVAIIESRTLPIFVTSERIEDLAKLGPKLARLLSRFITVRMQPVRLHILDEIVRRFAATYDLSLTDTEVETIRASGISDMGVLTAALARIAHAPDRSTLDIALEDARTPEAAVRRAQQRGAGI